MSLDTSDLETLSDFFTRAIPAIIASGWKAPALSILDLYAPGTCHAGVTPRPDLVPLAIEYQTLKPLIFDLVGADPTGKVMFQFRTFAHDETSNWELDDTPLKGVPVFGLYMLREDDFTGYGKFLENVFCYDDSGKPANKYDQGPAEEYLNDKGQELPSDNGGNDGFERLFFAHSKDAANLDADPRLSPRYGFAADIEELDLSKLDTSELTPRRLKDELLDRLAENASESAFEWFSGNACHPSILLTTKPKLVA